MESAAELVPFVRRGLLNLHYSKGTPCDKCGLPAEHPIHMNGKEYAGMVRNEAMAALDALLTALQHTGEREAKLEGLLWNERVKGMEAARDIAVTARLPKERWSCSDDASGTALTLSRQRQFIADEIKATINATLAEKEADPAIRQGDRG